MMWVCPLCWKTFTIHQLQCPACDADLALLDDRSYRDTLIRALDHPEQDTAMRAARILATRGEADDTIQTLARALRRRWGEPYVAAAFIDAIGEFTTEDAHRLLIEGLDHNSIIVRAAAARRLQRQTHHH